jgi:hypothetical protein
VAGILCAVCQKREIEEIDHIEPVGKRPYTIDDLVPYIKRMLGLKCQGLCRPCHKTKTSVQRGKHVE